MGRDWTETERLAAMYLYCQLPFGRMHSRNPEIIALAGKMGRTPSSLAMKLTNFASMDPIHQKRGVKGLRGASSDDRHLWQRFHADWNAMVEKSASAFDSFLVDTPSLPEQDLLPPTTPSGPTTISRTVKARRGQDWFRMVLLASYEGSCCITGCNTEAMLVASHIIPWSENEQNRLNPQNGLILSAIHDRAFEKGFLAIDEEYKILISSEFLKSKNDFIKTSIASYHKQPLRTPKRFPPDPSFLKQHRESVFRL